MCGLVKTKKIWYNKKMCMASSRLLRRVLFVSGIFLEQSCLFFAKEQEKKMVEVTSIGGGENGTGARRATAAASASFAAASSEKETSSSGVLSVRPLSPSTRVDAATGVLISEYYASDGELKMQYPSQAAIAYLRSGLTEAGQTPVETGVTA